MRTIRVAAHVHSDWSYDGRYSLGEVAATFARLRYKAVLLSEHDRGWDERRWIDFQRACREASGEILLVPGIEYSDAVNAVHVLVWGCEPFLGAGLETAALLDLVAEHEGVAVLAHPGRRDAAGILGADTLRRFQGIEVWNRKYDGVRPSALGEQLAVDGQAIRWAGLDFHNRRQLFPLAMRVRLRGADLSVAAVYEALRLGGVEARALGAPVRLLARPPVNGVLRVAERSRRAGLSAVRSLR